MRFQFIADHKHLWPVKVQCKVLLVSTAAYYKWNKAPVSKAQLKRDKIVKQIRSVHNEKRLDDYGSPRMHKLLIQQGCQCSENTVAKLMRQENIKAKSNRKFRCQTTTSNHDLPIAPNRLDQVFVAQNQNQVWLTDFTYIPTKEGFTYLCTVLDLFSRRIVGWKASRNIDTQCALDALEQAFALRQPQSGLIVHSDRGSQFASHAYRKRIQDGNALQSMSRKGNCYDNAPMESFFKSFKSEEVYQNSYASHDEAVRATADYIERFYNCKRMHSSLNYKSPMDYEQKQLAKPSLSA